MSMKRAMKTVGGLGVITMLWVGCTSTRTADDDDGETTPADDDDDDSHTSTGGLPSAGSIAAACDGIQVREQACFQDDSFDYDGCINAASCFRLQTRDDAEDELLQCYANWANDPDCGGRWCTENLGLYAQPEHESHELRCSNFTARCGTNGGDICNNSVLHLEQDILVVIAPCFEQGCDDLEACVNAAASKYLDGCSSYPL